MEEIKIKCKNEIRSFFGLTIINLVIAALIVSFGIGIGTTQLTTLLDIGQIQLIPILLIIASFLATIVGIYWIIKTAEILDGVDDINTTYEQTIKNDNQEKLTQVLIQMIAHYRKNQPIINKMSILGHLGGIFFLIAGSLSLIYAINTIITFGTIFEGITQFVGSIIAFGVGIGSLLIAKYFKRYSGVWKTRLQEENNIKESLNKKLEAV